MTDLSADEMVERMRQSLLKLLEWAEAYEPRTFDERTRYDADLDEAENLLDDTEAWIAMKAEQWLRNTPKKGT